MSTLLPQITGEKLDAFANRRRWLLGVRGLCVTLFFAVMALLLAVTLDGLFDFQLTGRMLLSGIFYLSSLGCIVTAMVLPLAHRWQRRTTAMAIESLVPELKEELLPAVEMASAGQSRHAERALQGSAAFGQHLQQQVAVKMAPLSIAGLLPLALIGRWLMTAVGVAVLFTIAILVPNWQMKHRIARVLLPTANFGKPSSTRIQMTSPQPSSQTVARGEVQRFSAAIDRLIVDQDNPVVLQLRYAEGSNSEVPMRIRQSSGPSGATDLPESDRQSGADRSGEVHTNLGGDSEGSAVANSRYRMEQIFEEAFSVERELRYRVVADGAQSPWYQLMVADRPAATKFRKRIKFPDYAKTPNLLLEADGGDVFAVVGSRIELGVQADQTLAQASMEMKSSRLVNQKTESVSLEQAEGNWWQQAIEFDQPSVFRFAGASQQTGLATVFGKWWRIEPVADLPPSLQWTGDVKSQQVVPAEAVIRLQLKLQDEFPVDDIRLLYRIDRGNWRQDTILKPTAPAIDGSSLRYDSDLEWRFDLLGKSLQSNQLVEVKVVAKDRKGQERDSALLTMSISEAQLESAVSSQLSLRLAMLEQVRKFEQSCKPVLQRVADFVSAWDRDPSQQDPLQLPDLVDDYLDQLMPSLDESRNRILAMTGQFESSVSANELQRINEYLNNIGLGVVPRLQQLKRTLTAAQSPQDRKEQASQLVDLLRSSSSEIVKLESRVQRFVIHDILDDVGDDLHAALLYSTQLSTAGDIASETWIRQQDLLGQHLRAVASKMILHSEYVDQGQANKMREWSRWSGLMADRVDEIISNDVPEESVRLQQIQDQQRTIINEIGYHQGASQIAGNSTQESLNGQNELQKISGQAFEIIRQISEDAKKLGSATSASAGQLILSNGLAEHMQAAGQLVQRRKAELVRADGDGRFAADLGLAYRASHKVLIDQQETSAASEVDDTIEKLQSISSLFQKLEAGHRLVSVLELLRDVKSRERFAFRGYASRSESPREWENFTQWLGQAVEELRQAKLPGDLLSRLDEVRWSGEVGSANQKISSRKWDQNQKISAAGELDIIERRLLDLQDLLAIHFDQTRQELERYAPTISELATQAAVVSRQQEQVAQRLANEQKQDGIPNLSDRLQRQYQQQTESSAPMALVQQALEDVAVSQDLLDAKQRRLAKDADVGRAMVQRSQELVGQAMAKASTAQSSEVEKALSELADKQSQAAQAYDLIANHFSKIDSGELSLDEDQASSRQAMVDLAKAMQDKASLSNESLDREYQQAKQLQELADASQDDLLKQLEAELRRSPEMQTELSKISDDILRQAKETLDAAAKKEEAIQNYNQVSDLAYQQRKDELKLDLQIAATRTLQLSQRLGGEARDLANQAGNQARVEQMKQAATTLQEAALSAESVQARSPIKELQGAAQDLSDALNRVAPELKAAAQKFAEDEDTVRYGSAIELTQAQANLSRQQTNHQKSDQRQAEQLFRQQQNQLQNADRNRKQTQQQIQQQQREVDGKAGQLKQKPGQEWAVQQLRDAERNLNQAKEASALAEASWEQQKERVDQLKQQQEAIENRELEKLDTANPAAQLAKQLVQQAAADGLDLAKQFEEIADDNQWQQQLQTSKQQLQAAAQEQQAIGKAISQQASSLQRAAAHEQRLQNNSLAQQVQQLADRVQQTADQPLSQVEASMGDAGKLSQTEEQSLTTAKATAQQANAIQSQLADALQALEQRSQELQQAIDQNQPTPSAPTSAPTSATESPQPEAEGQNQVPSQDPSKGDPQTAAGQSSEPSTKGAPASGKASAGLGGKSQDALRGALGELLSPADKARMLDQLDRQQRRDNADTSPGESGNPAGQQGSNPQALSQGTDSLSQAAKRLASQMNRQRQSESSSQSSSESSSESSVQSQAVKPSPSGQSRQSFSGNGEGPAGGSVARTVDLETETSSRDWGRLRKQSAEDVVDGSRESVSPRYRQQVDAYFKILSQQRK